MNEIQFCVWENEQVVVIGENPPLAGTILVLAGDLPYAPVGFTRIPGGYWRIASSHDGFAFRRVTLDRPNIHRGDVSRGGTDERSN